MRGYREYITNLDDFDTPNLYNSSGIIRILINGKSYITYGKSIASLITSHIVRLEQGNGVNQKLQEAYDKYGDHAINIEIIEVGSYETLRERSKKHIFEHKAELNYQRRGIKEDGSYFSKEHRTHMSESKTGEKHNRAKLTEEQAIEIKKLALYGNFTSVEIAKRFNISSQQVRKIKSGAAWPHLSV